MHRSEASHAYWNRRYQQMVREEQRLAKELMQLQELLLLAMQETAS
jgi:hypothetical protein